MGLRTKIISLFFIGFVLMTVIALELLHSNLQQSFVEMERRQAINQMNQLAHNLTNELNRLELLTNNWANWDAMYQFAQHPTDNFIMNQIIPGAKQTPGLGFLLVLNRQDKTIFSKTFNAIAEKKATPVTLADVFANIKYRIKNPADSKPCGLDISPVGPVLVCWRPIQRALYTNGTNVGTVAIGRLVDEKVLKRIEDQSSIEFQINPLSPDEKKELPISEKISIAPEQIEFSKRDPNILKAHLNNILGQPILGIRLQFSQDISQQGHEIIVKLRRVLLIVTALTGLTLLIGIHFLVIRRLRKMEAELHNIWRTGRWAGRLTAAKGNDELSQLANSINRILELIRKQVSVLELNAHTDALTRIANRRSFDQRLAVEMSLAKRNKTPLSILIIDVDYFKRYNDYYGHPAGDNVLREMGRILSHVAYRPSDLPARIGGEEFAVILPATDLQGALFVAEKIALQLAKQQIAHADSLVSDYVTTSIGVATATDEDVASFLQRADKATYQAKQSGRNQICSL